MNKGSYTWVPPASIVPGERYTFEIVNNDSSASVNYSGEFAISSSPSNADIISSLSSLTTMPHATSSIIVTHTTSRRSSTEASKTKNTSSPSENGVKNFGVNRGVIIALLLAPHLA